MTQASTVATVAVVAALFAPPCARAQTAAPTPYRSPWRTPWDYQGARGAAHWSQLDSEYSVCNEGRAQSPIDIRQTQRADLPGLEFHSKAGPLQAVINNGHTIRVDYRPGNGDSLIAGGKRYELAQFHFHHPSEETGFGEAYPMAAHLMYQAGDREVAGVTVFIKAGGSNPTVGTVWAHMPQTEGQNEVTATEFDPAGLLPSDPHGYFTYDGSLTAPPCTEGVTWYVLKTPIELSPGQIAAFARLYPMNARPVQPLNDRIVRERR